MYILARLLGEPHSPVPVLDDIPLRYLQTTMLTVVASHGSTARKLAREGPSVRLAAKAKAYDVFAGWPDAFHEMLDGMLTLSPQPRLGARSSQGPPVTPYRYYQHRLAAVLGRNAQKAILDAYEQHFLRTIPCGAQTQVYRKPVTESRHLTLAGVNELLGLKRGSRRLMPVLLDQGLIASGMPYSRKITVPRLALVALRAGMDDRLNLAAAARRLSVQDTVLKKLIDCGFLSPFQNEYDDTPRLSAAAIDCFVSALAANARRISKSDGSLMSLTEAARTKGQRGLIGTVRLIMAVQGGRLHIAAQLKDRTGLDGLLVRRKGWASKKAFIEQIPGHEASASAKRR